MRFSHVLVVIAAAFLATTDALSTSTETHAAQVASQDGPSQRLLRNHYTTGEDDEDSEARTLDAEKMKQMWEAGTTVDAYASKLKITNDIATAANSAKAMGKLAETHKFKKLMLYLNYVAEKQRSFLRARDSMVEGLSTKRAMREGRGCYAELLGHRSTHRSRA
ncbi:hypothetical protein Pcac1_g17135 [Phytophthora cactorum]|nr:hypothetical protein Pcac1_g17135 [Phytophthora cactorum]